MLLVQRLPSGFIHHTNNSSGEYSWQSILLGIAICGVITLIFYLLAMNTYRRRKKGYEEKVNLYKKLAKRKKKNFDKVGRRR
ncbi:hypothetical protein K6119_11500 [Paracrocinitomix mangrovi]|uniref:hypothetical protein n=1 Tax=Paracrocinitomix mangrovi TaxID=2862509 RepID=UPI001C8D7F71|nr:hypothetical protein [Paracrocinitomix mangrovi]UKN00359.1 hypothetical protein K6119_11500 [Paracrocinitomix mangrovi]